MKTLTILEKWSNQSYHVYVIPNAGIRIDCLYLNRKNPVPTSKTFKIGDRAEYDSYNLSYIGTIAGITEKTVTIEIDPSRCPDKRRLKIGEFCSRNWDFDLAKKKAYNAEEMNCI